MKAVYVSPAFTYTAFEPEEKLADISVGASEPDGDRDAVIIW